MNCYKCKSDKELSIKARNKDGSVRMRICRSCRREAYNARPYNKKVVVSTDVWEQSRSQVLRLSKRFP